MEQKAYISLYELQQRIGNAIRLSRETQYVWVLAELSDLRVAGGHCYMELLEKDAAGTTRAKVRAMIWSSALGKIRAKFFQATGREIASGMKVLLLGSATHHNLYGLSFTISDIDPSYTLGDMERLRREIIERLVKEGVAGCNRSLQIPATPQRIAVISAAGAAGYGDFANQIESNPDGFCVYPLLFPAVMQGERTTPSVMAALDMVESTLDLWDCVVIIRGGGATTDLNGFDTYELARRVATFPIPVVVGIGHERDRTVLDELACVRCKTPTAVAAWIIDSLRNSYAQAADLVHRIARFGSDAMRGEHVRLTHISQAIPAYAANNMMRTRMKLNELSSALQRSAGERIDSASRQLSEYSSRIEMHSKARIGDAHNALSRLAMRCDNSSRQQAQRENMKLTRLEDMLRILNPQNTLKRGYSITRVNGHALTDATEIKSGMEIETTLFNGTIKSKTI